MALEDSLPGDPQVPSGPQIPPGRRWPVDPSVRMMKKGGKPPAGHYARCQGTKRHSDPPRQCSNWRETGTDFCKYHAANGRKSLHRKKHTAHDMKRYSKGLSQTLGARLQELADEKPQARHSLEDEIDVARVLAERALKTFDQVCVEQADSTSPTAKGLATQLARDSMTHVADVVLKAAKVRAVSREVVDLEMLDYLTKEVEKVLMRRLEQGSVPRDVVDGILEELKAIEMPDRSSSKGGRAEAQQVLAALSEMESAVPNAGDTP